MVLNTSINVTGYVESKYNILCSVEGDGNILLYNSLYKCLIELNTEEYSIIENGTIDADSNLGKVLIEMNFEVHPAIDELEYYKYHYNLSRFDNSMLSLSILTTLACNMLRPYCYESKTNSFMTEQIADQIINWVDSLLSGKKTLSVNWFGGELLISLNIIEYLSQGFMSLCRKYNVEYIASITTNGYLPDSKTIQTLETYNVFDVQVTFDGNKETHGAIKYLANENGTYDCIVSNIINYCRISTSHSLLRIRVNLSDENYDSISRY